MNCFAGGFVGQIVGENKEVKFINCNTLGIENTVQVNQLQEDSTQVTTLSDIIVDTIFDKGISYVGGFVGHVKKASVTISGTAPQEASADGQTPTIEEKRSITKGTLVGGIVGGFIGKVCDDAKFNISYANSESKIISNTYQSYLGGYIGLNETHDYHISYADTSADISSAINNLNDLNLENPLLNIGFNAGGLIGRSVERTNKEGAIIENVTSSIKVLYNFSEYIGLFDLPIEVSEGEEESHRPQLYEVAAGGLIGYLYTSKTNNAFDSSRIKEAHISNFDLNNVDLKLIGKKTYAGGVIGYLINNSNEQSESYYISNAYDGMFDIDPSSPENFARHNIEILSGNIYANMIEENIYDENEIYKNVIEEDYSYAGGIIGFIKNDENEFNVELFGLASYVDVSGFIAGGLIGGTESLTKDSTLKIRLNSTNVGAIYEDQSVIYYKNDNIDENKYFIDLFDVHVSEYESVNEIDEIISKENNDVDDLFGSYKDKIKKDILLVQIKAVKFMGGIIGFDRIEEDDNSETLSNLELNVYNIYFEWAFAGGQYEHNGFNLIIGFDQYLEDEITREQIIHNGYVSFGGLCYNVEENSFIATLYQEEVEISDEDVVIQEENSDSEETSTEYKLEFSIDVNRETTYSYFTADWRYNEYVTDSNGQTSTITHSGNVGKNKEYSVLSSQVDSFEKEVQYNTIMEDGQYSILVGNNRDFKPMNGEISLQSILFNEINNNFSSSDLNTDNEKIMRLSDYTYFEMDNILDWEYNEEKNFIQEKEEYQEVQANQVFNSKQNAINWAKNEQEKVENEGDSRYSKIPNTNTLLSFLTKTRTMIYKVPKMNLFIKYTGGITSGMGNNANYAYLNPDFMAIKNRWLAGQELWDAGNSYKNYSIVSSPESGVATVNTINNISSYDSYQYEGESKEIYEKIKAMTGVTNEQKQMSFTALFVYAFGRDSLISANSSNLDNYGIPEDIQDKSNYYWIFADNITDRMDYNGAQYITSMDANRWNVLQIMNYIDPHSDEYKGNTWKWFTDSTGLMRFIAYVNNAYISTEPDNLLDGNIISYFSNSSKNKITSNTDVKPGDVIYSSRSNSPLRHSLMYMYKDGDIYNFIELTDTIKISEFKYDSTNNYYYRISDTAETYDHYLHFNYSVGGKFTTDEKGPLAGIPLTDYGENERTKTKVVTGSGTDYYLDLLSKESYLTAWEMFSEQLNRKYNLDDTTFKNMEHEGLSQVIYSALATGSRVQQVSSNGNDKANRSLDNGLTPVNCDADGSIYVNDPVKAGDRCGLYVDSDGNITIGEKNDSHDYNKMIHYANGVHGYINGDGKDANVYYGDYHEIIDGIKYFKGTDQEGNKVKVSDNSTAYYMNQQINFAESGASTYCGYGISTTIDNIYAAKQMYNDCIGFVRMCYTMSGYKDIGSWLDYKMFGCPSSYNDESCECMGKTINGVSLNNKTHFNDYSVYEEDATILSKSKTKASIVNALTPGDILGDRVAEDHYVIYLGYEVFTGQDSNGNDISEEDGPIYILYYIDQNCFVKATVLDLYTKTFYCCDTHKSVTKNFWGLKYGISSLAANTDAYYDQFISVNMNGFFNNRSNVYSVKYATDYDIEGYARKLYEMAIRQLDVRGRSDELIEHRKKLLKNALSTTTSSNHYKNLFVGRTDDSSDDDKYLNNLFNGTNLKLELEENFTLILDDEGIVQVNIRSLLPGDILISTDNEMYNERYVLVLYDDASNKMLYFMDEEGTINYVDYSNSSNLNELYYAQSDIVSGTGFVYAMRNFVSYAKPIKI